MPERKPWNQEYFREILSAFVKAEYDPLTFSGYFRLPRAERERKLLLRIDVDERIDRVPLMLEVTSALSIRATYFLHVHGTYNIFFYDNYRIVKDIISAGCEIGLHSNFVEFAKYFGEDPHDVIRREKEMLEAIVGRPIVGHACHRDLNYAYNSLPYFNQNGAARLGFEWNAYDPIFTADRILYVNEALAPRHLGWSDMSPEAAVRTNRNVCLVVHPHWWHKRFHTGA